MNFRLVFFYLFISFLLITLICCKESATIELSIDCDRLTEMHQEDQYYRTDPKAIPYQYVADSLFFMENGYRAKYKDIPMSYDKRAHQIVKGRPASDFVDLKYADSIVNLCRITDKKLTLELVDIIEMHDDSLLLQSTCFRQALLIFVHTPEELFPKVDSVLTIHRHAIPDANYKHIMRTFKHFGYVKSKEFSNE